MGAAGRSPGLSHWEDALLRELLGPYTPRPVVAYDPSGTCALDPGWTAIGKHKAYRLPTPPPPATDGTELDAWRAGPEAVPVGG